MLSFSLPLENKWRFTEPQFALKRKQLAFHTLFIQQGQKNQKTVYVYSMSYRRRRLMQRESTVVSLLYSISLD